MAEMEFTESITSAEVTMLTGETDVYFTKGQRLLIKQEAEKLVDTDVQYDCRVHFCVKIIKL